MVAFRPEPESAEGQRRQNILAISFCILALITAYIPTEMQQSIAWSMRVTTLRPFIVTQQWVAAAKENAAEAVILRAQLDSLTASVSSQADLLDENRILRDLLDLADRGEPHFRPATVLRSGIPGSESTFFLELGSGDGIEDLEIARGVEVRFPAFSIGIGVNESWLAEPLVRGHGSPGPCFGPEIISIGDPALSLADQVGKAKLAPLVEPANSYPIERGA